MRIARTGITVCAFVGFVLAGLAVSHGQQAAQAPGQAGGRGAGAQAQPPRPPVLHAMNLIMKPDDAVATGGGPVFGAASQTGFYMTRNRFGPNQTSRPHYHTMDRWVTVIKGTWYGGKGKVFRAKEMIPMPAGSVMYHPAYFIHFDGSQDGQETIVQIQGYGPVTTVQVEEDENGKPVSRGGGEGAGYAVAPPAK
ncbi:MAG: cupin domain-containing protein [Vicinamibacterales bacterium]|nr:cupin domain-containing protein [Vicinamibacterales bacterium]